jgi:predicted Zn-dependent protease
MKRYVYVPFFLFITLKIIDMNRNLNKNILRTGLLAFVLIAQACSTVPLIGRKQVSLLPESSMVEMSLTNYSEFLKENKLSTNKEQTDIVKRVGAKMSVAVEKYLKENGFQDRVADFKWEFNLVENKELNAWCMPGGKVVFYTGIMPVTKNDAGVAVVMGHEIGHAVARHGNERMSQQIIQQYGGAALSEVIKTKPEETKALFQSAYGLGTQYLIVLPYSRQQEYEGDKLGLIFMAIAGYDPKEAISFWERMAANSGAKQPEFLSTHPVEQNRIEAIKQFLPEAMKYYTSK